MFVNRQNLRRMFKLVFWHRNQADRLFLRIEDDPVKRVWDTIDLGNVMRVMPPKIDISPEGEVTVAEEDVGRVRPGQVLAGPISKLRVGGSPAENHL